jgi:hypothetical protein
MKTSPCASAPIINMLAQAERGEPTMGPLGRAHGMTATPVSRWRQQCGGMTVPDTQRWRALEPEHTRRKRLLAARHLAVEARQARLAQKSWP